MLEKKAIKKLYVLSEEKVENYEEACKREEGNKVLASYSNKLATYRITKDSFAEWCTCIIQNNFNIMFGVGLYAENGANLNGMPNGLTSKLSKDPLESFEKISALYFSDIIYYEIEDDSILLYSELSGHLYKNSPYESCDDCGNCDGGRCEFCKRRYFVKDLNTHKLYYTGYDKKAAEAAYKHNSKTYKDIFNDIIIYHKPDMEYYNNIEGREMCDLMDLLTHENILYYITRKENEQCFV